MLIRTTTWTLQRDSAQGLSFTGVNYYDGQGFMVKKSASVKTAKELGGATVCVQTGTTTELNLADFFRTNNLQYKPVVFEKVDEAVSAYQADRCDAYTTDASGLYAARLLMQPTRRSRGAARHHLQGAAGADRCARATASGSPSSGGCTSPC